MIDAHMHLWDVERHSYDWLADEGGLARQYQLDDYRRATAPEPPAGFVFVQAGCADTDGASEARWVHAMGPEAPDLAGVVAWAPIDDGAAAVASHLDELALPLVRGVRRLIQSAPAGLCTQPDFIAGVAELGRRNLAFDVCIHPRQLGDALALARGATSTRLVLDHLAKPDIAGGGMGPWRAGFEALAACDNVWCKLSGLVTEANLEHWRIDDLRPYVDIAFEAFGPARMLWGSDWPVVTNAASWARWREATSELLGELSGPERHAIEHQTAVDVYRLEGF